jgi:hypothetical protein
LYLYEPVPLPVLLDYWGNPIVYMPAYNSYTNHMQVGQTSLASGIPGPFPLLGAPTPVTVSVGPLLGWPKNDPLYYKYNTPMNSQTQSNSYTGPSIFWSAPLTPPPTGAITTWDPPHTTFTTGQVAAMLYKLGDHDGNNMINDTESLAIQQPYFLMSPGADGVYTDFYPGANAPPLGSNASWQTISDKSDDVYSFEP